jgi:YegS/Rv2252/BmrU family lipid kinase
VPRIAFLVNPASDNGKTGKLWPELAHRASESGLVGEALLSERPGQLAELTVRAGEGGAEVVVAVGGDGTVNEVVNGMFDGNGRTVADEPVLGVVAAGSGCDFIRTFGLPGDASRACLHLTGDNTYPLDVGKITYTTVSGGRDVRYFANVAEAGLFAAVAARAERMSPHLGGSKYFFGFWATLPRFRLATVRVQADGKTYEGPAFAVVAANAQYNGGGMKISPRSYPGDGVLDVLVFKGPRSDAFTMIPKVYRGEHLPHDHVEEFRVKERLVVEAERPLPIEADGEVLGNTPATFEVLSQVIRMKL